MAYEIFLPIFLTGGDPLIIFLSHWIWIQVFFVCLGFVFWIYFSHYIVKAGLELVIFLPLSPKSSNYKCVPPHPAGYKPFIRYMYCEVLLPQCNLPFNFLNCMFWWVQAQFRYGRGITCLSHVVSIFCVLLRSWSTPDSLTYFLVFTSKLIVLAFMLYFQSIWKLFGAENEVRVRIHFFSSKHSMFYCHIFVNSVINLAIACWVLFLDSLSCSIGLSLLCNWLNYYSFNKPSFLVLQLPNFVTLWVLLDLPLIST
jgi:hypothetical protein